MAIYRITGADRVTAIERTVVLEAADEKSAATAAAKEHNLLVAKMRLVPPPKVNVPPATHDVGSLAYAVPTLTNDPLPPEPQPMPIIRAPTITIPNYGALLTVSIVLRIIGGLAILISIILFCIVLWASVTTRRDPGPTEVLFLVPTVGMPFVSGLVLYALAELLACVRDMSINSFRQLMSKNI